LDKTEPALSGMNRMRLLSQFFTQIQVFWSLVRRSKKNKLVG
jgi:hypothetical protein